MSAFSDLASGLRGLFRSRWETAIVDETISDGGEFLDVLTAQLEGDWSRPGHTRAVRTLRSGEVLLVQVGRSDELDGHTVVMRLVRWRWGHISSSTAPLHLGTPWPEGDLVGVVSLEGDEEALASLLDPDARQVLPQLLMGQNLRLVESTVEIDVASGDHDILGLLHQARMGLQIIELLAEARRDARQRLVERTTTDPERAVRLHAARVLGESLDIFSDPEEILLAVVGAGELETAAIVTRALPHVDPGGLAALVMDPFNRNAVRACAAACLCELPSPPQEALLASLDLRPGRVVQLAPSLLGRDDLIVRSATLARLAPILRRKGGSEMSGKERTRLLEALRLLEHDLVDRILVEWQDGEDDDLLTLQTGEILVERGRPDLAGAAARRLALLARTPGSTLRPRAVALLHRVDREAVDDDLLTSLLDEKNARVWRSALELAVTHQRRSLASALPPFVDWMESDEAEVILGLLGQLGGPGAEEQLRSLLCNTRDRGLLMSAAIALGQAGSLASVEALVELEERGGDLGREARFSIEQIQQRVGANGRGGLSLSEEDGGRLAIARDDGGLELAEE
jgi:hypothetical protein